MLLIHLRWFNQLSVTNFLSFRLNIEPSSAIFALFWLLSVEKSFMLETEYGAELRCLRPFCVMNILKCCFMEDMALAFSARNNLILLAL